MARLQHRDLMKQGFPDPLIVRHIAQDRWRLYEGFRYVSESRHVYYVPRGFLTDFASVPRFFWRLIPKTGHWSEAAVIHDRLYATAEVKRETADAIFLEMMTHLGVATWRRVAMYRAVRAFGWIPWTRIHGK